MTTNYDIKMSLEDTLELDTIIEESNRASDSLTYDSDNFELSEIQTHTNILNPKNPGEYTITVNGQNISVKVTDPSTIPDSDPYNTINKSWFELEDSKKIWNSGFNDRDSGNVTYSIVSNTLGGYGLEVNGTSDDNAVYKQSAEVDLTDYSTLKVYSEWNHDSYSQHGVFIDDHNNYDSNDADVEIANGEKYGDSGSDITDVDVSGYSGTVWVDLYIRNRNFQNDTANAIWHWLETLK